MKTAVKPDLKTKTFGISRSYTRLIEKEISLVSSKFYQKLFLVLVLLSTILIFPESPKELETICQYYHSRQICNVW